MTTRHPHEPKPTHDADEHKDHKLVIEGVTEEGETFRPSDWAERMSGQLATFRHHRMTYSPLLKPGVKNGIKCVIVDDKLKESDPQLYQELLEFAKSNHLRMCDDVDGIDEE